MSEPTKSTLQDLLSSPDLALTVEGLFAEVEQLRDQVACLKEEWKSSINFGRSMHDQNEKLFALEKAVRVIHEDVNYGSGGFDHHDDCNIYHSWGQEEEDTLCDCYVRIVVKALEALK